MFLVFLLFACIHANKMILFDTRNHGVNNQMDQFLQAMVLARETGYTLVMMDIWPDWTLHKRNVTNHVPFDSLFSIKHAISAGLNIKMLRHFNVECNATLDVSYNNGKYEPLKLLEKHPGSKHDWLGITSKTTIKREFKTINEFKNTVDSLEAQCIGVFPFPRELYYTVASADESVLEKYIPYYNHLRHYKKFNRTFAHQCIDFSPRLQIIATSIKHHIGFLDNNYLGIHVRRGDYRELLCYLEPILNNCPSNGDIIRCIQKSRCDKVFIATNDKSIETDLKSVVYPVEIRTSNDIPGISYGPGERSVIDQIMLTDAYVTIGVARSSFSGFVLAKRDSMGIPYSRSRTWMDSCDNICA
jgi:hypothetical protein